MSKRNVLVRIALIVSAPFAALGCGTSSPGSFVEYQIVAAGGGSLNALVGDAFRLSVVESLSDGTTQPLSSGAAITWSGPATVTALPEGSSPTDTILPRPGDSPTAFWIENPEHLMPAQVAAVLYVLDAGTATSPSVQVSATIAGASIPSGSATATLAIGPFPTGNVARGQTVYTANCASCHGAEGEGAAAPGLNNEADHVVGDPDWTPQMLGFAARSNMDNDGVSLAATMPKWLLINGAAGKPLTTQDFADTYAFLATQHGEGPSQGP